jgi:hypothetical protein
MSPIACLTEFRDSHLRTISPCIRSRRAMLLGVGTICSQLVVGSMRRVPPLLVRVGVLLPYCG